MALTKASEIVEKLQAAIDEYGDGPVCLNDGCYLQFLEADFRQGTYWGADDYDPEDDDGDDQDGGINVIVFQTSEDDGALAD